MNHHTRCWNGLSKEIMLRILFLLLRLVVIQLGALVGVKLKDSPFIVIHFMVGITLLGD